MTRRVKYVTEDHVDLDYEHLTQELYKKTRVLTGNYTLVVTASNYQLTFDAYRRIANTYPNTKVVVLWLRSDRDGLVVRFTKNVPVVNWWLHAFVEQSNVREWTIDRVAYAMHRHRTIADETKFSYYAPVDKESEPLPYPLRVLEDSDPVTLEPTFMDVAKATLVHQDDVKFRNCCSLAKLSLTGLPYKYYIFLQERRRTTHKQLIEEILKSFNPSNVDWENLKSALKIYLDSISYEDWSEEADCMELMYKFDCDNFSGADCQHPYLRGKCEGLSENVKTMLRVIRLIDLLKKLPGLSRHLIPRFQFINSEQINVEVGSLAASLLAAFHDTHE